MKATERYFSVVLFIMLYKVVLTFESVAAIPGVIEWPFTWKFLGGIEFVYSKVCFWALFFDADVRGVVMVVLWWWWWHCFIYYKLNLRLYILFQDSKLLRAITKIVEDWIKTKVVNLLNEHFNYSYWLSVFLVNTNIILVVAAIKITTYFVFSRHSWQFSGCPYWERSQRCL